ncbi:MAG: cytochrome c biogenesis protein CcsA [Alphaproteobacteria bacterium]
MPHLSFWLQLGAIASIMPMIAGQGFARPAETARLPLLAAVALAGTGTVVFHHMADGWASGFASSLWIIVSATLLIFLLGTVLDRRIRGLSLLIALYTLPLAVLATVWSNAVGVETMTALPDTWTLVHVVTAVLTFAMLTLAACAGVAVLLRERALKRKDAGGLTNRLVSGLPAVRDAEGLEFQLLAVSAGLLAIGILSGMAVSLLHDGTLIVFDHKSVLTLIAFAGIVAMLFAHWRFGLRGRLAVRYLLGAHLALTLAYPGVKFVTDVLLV